MFKIVLCILSAVLVAECTLSTHIAARTEISLGNFLLAQQGRALSPTSAQCFPIYLPLLNEAADLWSKEYEACVKTEENARSRVSERAYAHQKEISAKSGAVCDYIQSCDAETESLSALDCFGLLSSETLSDIYVVSNNASDVADSLRQELNTIDFDSYRCSNASERRYVERSAKIYDAMNACLENGPPPTVKVPETTTTGTTSTSPLPWDEVREILQPAVAAVPRRTPALLALKNQQENEELIKPVPRSGSLISMLNNWLDQQENQDVDNV